MADIAVSNKVTARNGLGQFIRDCEQAAEYTVRDAIEEGAKLSRALAPSGTKPDPRTVPLKDSITSAMTSRTQGHWSSSARHALAIEKGASPHGIPGNVSFFWENQGRWWTPGSNVIQHPGNAAQPYLRPAYEVIMHRIMGIARRHYP
jgi:hypothetical protein